MPQAPLANNLKVLASAVQSEIRTRVREAWDEAWTKESHGKTTRKLTKDVLKKFKRMTRPESTTYPDPVAFPDITLEEIPKAVFGFPAQSAPGADKIPNQILKIARSLLLLYMLWLFNNPLHLGYYPRHFRDSVTISLRKPGKPDYHIPKAYRPIALLNTLGKAMDSIIATRLSWAAETFELLPRGHLGGRKGTSPEHALHILWNQFRGRGTITRLQRCSF